MWARIGEARKSGLVETVKTYPDLSQHCLQKRLDLPLRLWYLLRQEQSSGRGWLALDDIYRLSCGGRRQTRTWLHSGVGIFWTVDDRGRYWLAGLGALCERLGVKVNKSPVHIKKKDLTDLQGFRAMLYKSWFVSKPKTVSQKLLGDVFGRSDRTLRDWATVSGLQVQHNGTFYPGIPKPEALHKFPLGIMAALGIKYPEEESSRNADKRNLVWLECWADYPTLSKKWKYEKGDKPAVMMGMVNTYHATRLKVGKKTTLQWKASRRVKKGKRLQAPGNQTAGANGKRYFPERGRRTKKNQKAIARAIEGGGAFQETRSFHHGRRMWELTV